MPVSSVRAPGESPAPRALHRRSGGLAWLAAVLVPISLASCGGGSGTTTTASRSGGQGKASSASTGIGGSSTCRPGTKLCGDVCVDPDVDPANCGSCGKLCVAGEVCSNNSPIDCNVAGTTLLPGSAFVDPSPPATWTQCAGFVNTAGDDVTANFLDNCLNTTRLRIRVFTSANVLEEDFYVTDMSSWAAWPSFNYLGGTYVAPVKTHWGTTTFFTNTDGKDACLQVAAPSGTVFGTGDGNVGVIAGGNRGYTEYRINCGGMSLPDRKVALYR
jgi:hypothetical protein